MELLSVATHHETWVINDQRLRKAACKDAAAEEGHRVRSASG